MVIAIPIDAVLCCAGLLVLLCCATLCFGCAALHCRLQEGDVNDPWLQQEWGLMLVAAGRVQEALAYLEVAGGAGLGAWLSVCAQSVFRVFSLHSDV